MKKYSILVFFITIVFILFIVFKNRTNEVVFDEVNINDHNLKIIYVNNRLILNDNGKEILMMNNFNYSKSDMNEPQIKIVNEYPLIYFTYKTNKIGSLLVLWSYDYTYLDKVFDIDQKKIVKYKFVDNYLMIDDLGLKEKVKLNNNIEYNKNIYEGELDITSPLYFNISSNGEIITTRLIMLGLANYLETNKLLTYYKFEEGKFIKLKYKIE